MVLEGAWCGKWPCRLFPAWDLASTPARLSHINLINVSQAFLGTRADVDALETLACLLCSVCHLLFAHLRSTAQVQLPETGQSFALIYSIEDPLGNTPQAGVGLQVRRATRQRAAGGHSLHRVPQRLHRARVCLVKVSQSQSQVMGPDDGYICQFTPNVTGFWAERNRLALGATFKPANTTASSPSSTTSSGSSWSSGSSGSSRSGTAAGGPRRLLPADSFFAQVEQGFQASDSTQQGRMVALESGAAGGCVVSGCEWIWVLCIETGKGLHMACMCEYCAEERRVVALRARAGARGATGETGVGLRARSAGPMG